MENLKWPVHKINGKLYKVIYRATKEGCTKLLTDIERYKFRKYDQVFWMWANYFLVEWNE